MAIETKKVATYKDLVNGTINTIKNLCSNVGSFSSAVPTQWYNGHQYTKTATFKTKVVAGTVSSSNTSSTVTYTLNANSLIKVVPESTVVSQLEDFMKTRGIFVTEDNTVMTSRGIINFMVNAAAFIKARVTVVSSNVHNVSLAFYNTDNSSYVDVTSINNVDPQNFSLTYVDQLNKALNNIDRHQTLTYNTKVSCCSSSSSSSSSSCSSSCSSSFFIAYMEL